MTAEVSYGFTEKAGRNLTVPPFMIPLLLNLQRNLRGQTKPIGKGFP